MELVHIAPCTPCIPRKDGVRDDLVYIPCYLCEDVVREGSMRFDVLEPHRTSAYSTLHSFKWFDVLEPP